MVFCEQCKAFDVYYFCTYYIQKNMFKLNQDVIGHGSNVNLLSLVYSKRTTVATTYVTTRKRCIHSERQRVSERKSRYTGGRGHRGPQNRGNSLPERHRQGHPHTCTRWRRSISPKSLKHEKRAWEPQTHRYLFQPCMFRYL